MADPDRIFLPCFQCGLFHSVAVEGVGGPAVWCIYSFIYSFLNLAQQGSALGFEMGVLLDINNNQIGV